MAGRLFLPPGLARNRSGIDCNARDNSGMNVLMWAAGAGHLAVVEALPAIHGIERDARDRHDMSALTLGSQAKPIYGALPRACRIAAAICWLTAASERE